MKNNTVVILGASGVGKSAIIAQFMKGKFSRCYKPTIEEKYIDTIKLIDGIHHLYEVVDTSGMYEFPAMRQMNIANNNAFIVVFSVDDHQSFQQALNIADNINRTKRSEKYVFLVSNKNDLTDDARTVSHEEALGAAMSRNCHFIETSAASNTGVQTLFVGILNKMMHVTAHPSIPHWTSKWLFRKLSFGKSDKTHFKTTYKT